MLEVVRAAAEGAGSNDEVEIDFFEQLVSAAAGACACAAVAAAACVVLSSKRVNVLYGRREWEKGVGMREREFSIAP